MAAGPTLRIVHAVRSDAFAGVERSVLLSARALADRGHDVSVVGGQRERMEPELTSFGVGWAPAASTLDVVRALRRTGRVDVVHAHMTAGEVASVLAHRSTGGAIVMTRHFAQRRGRSAPGRLASVLVARVPHREIAISQYVAGRVESPHVVYHGIDAPAVTAAPERRVVVIQRLEREKHTRLAVQAWERSGLAGDGWELVIAGDGADRRELEAMAAATAHPTSIRFVGRVDDVDALRASAALQLATPPDEHFGLSVLEAMALGLPVVAADGGAHRELLGDDHPELLFTPDDVAAATERLRALAEDPELRQRTGAALRARQQSLFSLAAHGEALEREYRAAIDACTARAGRRR
jgi:glycosyltransferase involved in cell wall biosynthesis